MRLLDAGVVALCAAVLAIGCAESAAGPVPNDAGRDASTDMDSGIDAAVDAGDAAIEAGPELDAMLPDAAPADAATDAAVDASPPTCQLSACPAPTVTGEFLSVDPPQACCIADRCGVDFWGLGDSCEVIEPGSSDEDCLDADLSAVDGGIAVGCCRSDNTCGHLDPQLGCHHLINELAWFEELKSCEGHPAEVPEGPFMCKGPDAPCTYDWECCRHYNYETQCSTAPGTGDQKVCNTCPEC